MSERLTQRGGDSAPRWLFWFPVLLHAAFAAFLLASAPVTWGLAAPPPTLYLSLFASLPERSGPLWHVALSLALLWNSGRLVSKILPAKSNAPVKTLAQCLGSATVFMALTPWIVDLLGANSLLPALVCLLGMQLTLLQSLLPGRHPRAALAGLLGGLAAGLSFFVGTAGASALLWLMTDVLRKTDRAGRRLAFFAAGLVVGALPFLRGVSARVEGRPELSGDWAASLLPVYTLFGIGGILLILLGLLVGALQKNRVLLTCLLLPALLLKAAHALMPAPSPAHTGTLLFFPALFFAYGVFRILKGVESGVYSVNPAKAKSVMLTLLILLLAGVKLWTARMFSSL